MTFDGQVSRIEAVSDASGILTVERSIHPFKLTQTNSLANLGVVMQNRLIQLDQFETSKIASELDGR